MRLPVSPNPDELPLNDPAFSWERFERFVRDFLDARPSLESPSGPRQVRTARLHGDRGAKQDGFDVLATMDNGEEWVFECKQRTKGNWNLKKTKDVIAKCVRPDARRKILVLTTRPPETCFEEIRKAGDWELWDPERLSSLLKNKKVINHEAATRLVRMHFGAGWVEEFLGVPAHWPLMTAEVFFEVRLSDDQWFHHRLALRGRDHDIATLGNFESTPGMRTIIVAAPGGMGKSRVLLEWAKSPREETKIRFFDGDTSELKRVLDVETGPLIIVLDDAHRMNDERRALMRACIRRQNIKLVFGTRPHSLQALRIECFEEGFAEEEVQKLTLSKISDDAAREILEELDINTSGPHGRKLAHETRQWPVIALMAAAGKIRDAIGNPNDLLLSGFEQTLEEASGAESRVAKVIIAVIALLTPGPSEDDVLTLAEKLEPQQWSRHAAERALSDLIQTGMLERQQGQLRITPDLLSDHIAYRSCLQDSGHPSSLIKNLISVGGPEIITQVIGSVANTQWIANKRSDSENALLAPIWELFLQEFRRCKDDAIKSKFFEAWLQVAAFYPELSLELATLLDAEREIRISSVVAAYNALFVDSCMTRIWVHLRATTTTKRLKDQAISALQELAKWRHGKPDAVYDKILDWISVKAKKDWWSDPSDYSGVALTNPLSAFFETLIEDTWSSNRTVTFSSQLLSLSGTRKWRERALDIAASTIATHGVGGAMAALSLIGAALEPARSGYGSAVSDAYRAEWLEEQLKALDRMQKFLKSQKDPLVLFKAREVLLLAAEYGSSEPLHAPISRILEELPETIELLLARTVLGSSWNDSLDTTNARETSGNAMQFSTDEGDSDRQFDLAEKNFREVCRATAQRLKDEDNAPHSTLNFLSSLARHWHRHGRHPNFGPLFSAIATHHADWALELAESLIASPREGVSKFWNVLVYAATSNQLDQRRGLCERALKSPNDAVVAGAVSLTKSWRKDDQEIALDAAAWLAPVARRRESLIIRALMDYLTLGESLTNAEWTIFASLRFQDDDPLISDFLRRLSYAFSSDARPEVHTLRSLLSSLKSLTSLHSPGLDYTIPKIAEFAPETLLIVLWERFMEAKESEAHKGGPPSDLCCAVSNEISWSPELKEIDLYLRKKLRARDLDSDESWFASQLWELSHENGQKRLHQLIESAADLKGLIAIAKLIRAHQPTALVLEFPGTVAALFERAAVAAPDHIEKLVEVLSWMSLSRSARNGEPNKRWTLDLQRAEALAHEYTTHEGMGKLYISIVEIERDSMKRLRRTLGQADHDLPDSH